MHTLFSLFSFNDTPPTELYTLSLHDALPISPSSMKITPTRVPLFPAILSWSSIDSPKTSRPRAFAKSKRSEEHTSELQSQSNLVCRLLLEKKKKKKPTT